MTLSNGSHIAKGLEKIQKRKNYQCYSTAEILSVIDANSCFFR